MKKGGRDLVLLKPRPTIFACSELNWLQCGVGFPQSHPQVLHDLNNGLPPPDQSVISLLEKHIERPQGSLFEMEWGGRRIWIETFGQISTIEDLGGQYEDFRASTKELRDCLEIVAEFQKSESEIRSIAQQAWSAFSQGITKAVQVQGGFAKIKLCTR